MSTSHRIYLGTIGEGLWRSTDGGATFTRASDGMFVECHVRALVVHPARPAHAVPGQRTGPVPQHRRRRSLVAGRIALQRPANLVDAAAAPEPGRDRRRHLPAAALSLGGRRPHLDGAGGCACSRSVRGSCTTA